MLDALSGAGCRVCSRRGMSERTSTELLHPWCAVVDAPGGQRRVWWTLPVVRDSCGGRYVVSPGWNSDVELCCGSVGRESSPQRWRQAGLCWKVYPESDSRDCTSRVSCVGGVLSRIGSAPGPGCVGCFVVFTFPQSCPRSNVVLIGRRIVVESF